MDNKKSKPVTVTLADPFADVAADVWAELGIEPEPPPEETVAPESPPDLAPPMIEIRDEADMALASWLYLDEGPASVAPPTPLPTVPTSTEEELLDWLLSTNKPDAKTGTVRDRPER